ncbi:MAG: endopeptidase La [Acidobacteria bacterium]|nr:MAG: endopeptidase La [Acidobacteriota bacterium]
MADQSNNPTTQAVAKATLLPVLPLRDLVLFPGVRVPIAAGRPGTLRTIEAAQNSDDHLVFAVSQRQNVDEVTPEGLYTIGTVARIEQVQRTLGGIHLLLHGEHRGMAMRLSQNERGYLEALVRETDEMAPPDPEDAAFVALHREARARAAELAERFGLAREAVQQMLSSIQDPGRLADVVAGYLEIPLGERQALLETLSVEERLRRVLIHIQRQLTVFDAQEKIKNQVQEEIGDRQREIFLREQLKAIQNELGEDESDDVDELRQRLAELDLPPEARKEVDRELKRLGRINREAMEYQVIRTFLETVAELPWSKRSEEQLDIERAARILDEDHYGLRDVKDRVLEFLAVRQLRLAREARETEAAAETAPPGEADPEPRQEDAAATATTEPAETAPDGGREQAGGDRAASAPSEGAEKPEKAEKVKKGSKGPILLFAGPPGVGKTSLARSIARAMGREYVRISLGGARDEADIRGHRRTYVGAMPGRIIQGMKSAGTKNPVFLLDEIDKLGASFHGDPAAALLEVLDPAQNDSFVDHYLGVPFDLSEVLFICTANFLQAIPGPLLDRMELIEFDGYTEGEKLAIARQYLVPRQLEENGLDAEQITLTDEALKKVISEYTRESGVRQLEREIGRLARKVARKIAAREVSHMVVDAAAVQELLGRPKVHPETMAPADQVGVATGMYYTPAGGDIMFVEARTMRGKGHLHLTGQMGDVMKESARAAWSYARANAEALGIDPDDFERDVHIHVPAGAIPKDGPSAGVAMATALVSALSGRPVRNDLAMTGEITLSGRVLPIGGVKEKLLGGVRAGIKNFLLPADNERDLEDLPEEVRAEIQVTPVRELGEVLALALRDASYRDGRLLFGRAEEPGNPSTGISGGVEN